ncbi:hypothetical protein E2C01_050369 [Portunus trituberculatus]|uniref:Uncharacterized protein n=1 Tax=Portunus trituberculatus TaxID=210409 RepID=A0A5B7G834_PORTR|nr:hypothetical protein [Portunus trituberculatus]
MEAAGDHRGRGGGLAGTWEHHSHPAMPCWWLLLLPKIFVTTTTTTTRRMAGVVWAGRRRDGSGPPEGVEGLTAFS